MSGLDAVGWASFAILALFILLLLVIVLFDKR